MTNRLELIPISWQSARRWLQS